MVDPLSCFLFHPMLHNWNDKEERKEIVLFNDDLTHF